MQDVEALLSRLYIQEHGKIRETEELLAVARRGLEDAEEALETARATVNSLRNHVDLLDRRLQGLQQAKQAILANAMRTLPLEILGQIFVAWNDISTEGSLKEFNFA